MTMTSVSPVVTPVTIPVQEILPWAVSDWTGGHRPGTKNGGCENNFGIATSTRPDWGADAKGLAKPN
jgi:hypothetical protein